MIATDFTRNDCLLGRRRVTYNKLCRDYRCSDCGGGLRLDWDETKPDNWCVACAHCGGYNFVHSYELQRQKSESIEVWSGLPPEVAALLR